MWHTTGMSNSNTTTQPLTLGTDGMECNFCEQVIPWHELKSHQCQAKKEMRFQDVPVGGTFRWTENGAVMRKTGRTTYNYLERDGKNLSTHPLRTLYSPPYSVGSETDRPIFEMV